MPALAKTYADHLAQSQDYVREIMRAARAPVAREAGPLRLQRRSFLKLAGASGGAG